MNCRSATFVVLGTCMIALSRPAPLAAQGQAHLQSLTVPPPNAGTCFNSRGKRYVRATLVMTSRAPSARRELSLLRDSTGRVAAFNESLQLSTSLLASMGEVIVATLQPDGRIVGYRLSSQIEMAGNSLQRFDTASLRRMLDSAKRRSSRTLLSEGEQEKVRVLTAWLAKRCAQ